LKDAEKNPFFLQFLEHISEKICSVEFIDHVRPSSRLSVPYFFFAIFQPRVLKFWILMEDYLRTKSTAFIYDPLPRSSEIDLGLEPSLIRVFSLDFLHF
jgi:hypothetical protein